MTKIFDHDILTIGVSSRLIARPPSVEGVTKSSERAAFAFGGLIPGKPGNNTWGTPLFLFRHMIIPSLVSFIAIFCGTIPLSHCLRTQIGNSVYGRFHIQEVLHEISPLASIGD